jgi:hypothetical protein
MLTRSLISILALTFSLNASSAQKAITDDGKVVILNSDRTWQFEDPSINSTPKISVSSKQYTKISSQTFRVKASPTSFGVYINPDKWTFSKDKEESNKLLFRPKSKELGDIYAMLVAEGIQVPFESFPAVALENAKKVAPDIKILNREYRVVNGNKILYMELEGSVYSVKFRFIGYYCSNESGTVQLLVYSGSNIVSGKLSEIEEFLNGFSNK